MIKDTKQRNITLNRIEELKQGLEDIRESKEIDDDIRHVYENSYINLIKELEAQVQEYDQVNYL